ncbi:hypothetical protein L0244_19695 [bacterium]|nr:hypothetical protein [bacterium]
MFDCDVRVVDSETGLTQAIHFVQSPGLNPECSSFGHGLAKDPSNSKLYALIKRTGNNAYHLAQFDPGSGNLILIGSTGDRFDGLAFNQDGSALFGVTNDDASVPETLFLLNKTTGSASKLCTLGNGNDGEVIAFNTDDGLIYHSSGQFTDVFEKMNPVTCQISSIGLTPDNFVRPTALTYEGANNFLLADFDILLDLSTAGVISFTERFLDHASKGLALSTASITITDLELGGSCLRHGKSGLTESITIQNMSGIAAKNAIVGSRLPAQISFLSDSSNSCSSLQGFMVCQLGDLAAFSSTNLQIEYQVNLGRKENIRHDLRVSSNEFETPQEFSDNLLSINSKCKR